MVGLFRTVHDVFRFDNHLSLQKYDKIKPYVKGFLFSIAYMVYGKSQNFTKKVKILTPLDFGPLWIPIGHMTPFLLFSKE